MMQLTRVKLTYEEYFSLPEDNRPCELIDGELYMPPSPSKYQIFVRATDAKGQLQISEVVRPQPAARGYHTKRQGWPDCPSCSQNAHDQNVLVRCAQ